jgi:hypothetical protein
MDKTWIFVAKIPEAGYSVRFSKDIHRQLIAMGFDGLKINIVNEHEVMLTPSNEDYDMNIKIQSGIRKGNIKPIMNSKELHVKLAESKFFKLSELMEEAYGYRFPVIWSDDLEAYLVRTKKEEI